MRGLCDVQRQLLYYEGTVVDVTERKRAEEALRKSKEQFEAFMDHNPAVAFPKDEEDVTYMPIALGKAIPN